jgi:ASC-1-like (ASCH) protein
MKYTIEVSEPWFTLISLGLKKVEGRKNKGVFKEVKIGDTIKWTNYDFKPRSCKTKVIGKNNYNTFEEYLRKEGLQKCLPGIPSMEHGLSVYFKYYSREDEEKYGVTSILLELV